jgi:hypothetical protein
MADGAKKDDLGAKRELWRNLLFLLLATCYDMIL